MERNPYVISFGRIPTHYINRSLIIDNIIEILEADAVEEQAFKLTGIRGTGKTVTMTAIERRMRENEHWIVIGLRSNSNLTEDLIANLYSSVPFLTDFVNAELNLSRFGIGLNISSKSPVASLDYALKRILTEIKKRGKNMAKQDQELNVYEHFKHKTTTGEYYFLTIIDDNGVQTINLSTEDKDIFYFGTSIDNDILIVSDAVDYLQGYLNSLHSK